MDTGFKLTSKVGTFYFDADTILSHAKLTRDAVMGKILSESRGLRPKSTNEIYAFVKSSVGPASQTAFSFIPAPGYWIKEGLNQLIGSQHRNVQKVA